MMFLVFGSQLVNVDHIQCIEVFGKGRRGSKIDLWLNQRGKVEYESDDDCELIVKAIRAAIRDKWSYLDMATLSGPPVTKAAEKKGAPADVIKDEDREELSVRSRNLLTRARITRFSEINSKKLLDTKNCGMVAMVEIMNWAVQCLAKEVGNE